MKLSNKQSYLIIFLLFIIWRNILFIISLVSPHVIDTYKISFPYLGVISENGLPEWIWSFAGFDGVHYLRLAQEGYANLQFTQAFFPLYPILIRLVSYMTFDNYLVAALLISNAAFLAGLLLFYKLVEKNFDEKTALWSTILLLSFPTSFYFGAVYTEGLFFFLIIGSFYFFEQNRPLLASLFGTFASATRLVGVFLAPALIKGKKLKSIIPLAIVPLGLVAYSIYLAIEFGNPFYFLTAQDVWGQERSAQVVILPQVFFRYLKIFLTTQGVPLFNAILELAATVFAIVTLILATKKVKKEWLIFSWLAVLTPTLTGTLVSMPRYILVAFPIYIVLASIKSDVTKTIILIISTAVLIITTVLFTRGYWIA